MGTVALLAVVGDEGLDTVRLYRVAQGTVERLEGLLTGGAQGPGRARAAS